MNKLTKIKTRLIVLTLLIFGFNCYAVNTIGPWNITKLKRVPAYTITTDFAEEGMTGILYESLDYLDNKVEVFAYYSAPSGTMPEGGWPAVVYVHGGEGSALPTWVQYWNDRGYAAISMDHHGHYPDRTTNTPNPGPDKYGTWGDYDLPIDEQWYYHAVAQVIRATSLIGSFDEVNADKIGMTGTSWGGTLTSTIIGLDNRLKWAVPVYGGGYLSDSDGSQGVALQNEDIAAVVNANFDGRSYFSNVTIPTLWINGTNDSNFAMPVTKQSSEALSVPAKLRYSLRLKHNNTYVTNLEEIAAFADTVINGEEPMAEVGKPSVNSSNVATVSYTTSVGLSSGQLLYTLDDGTWYDRYWYAIDATVSGNTITANVPSGTTTLYFTATDSRGLMVSSEYIVLAEQENLALNGTATQSSTSYGALASRAIDGNTDGAWLTNSVTHTSAEDEAWWQVDLGADHSIDEIVIYNRTDDCCKERLSNFVVLMWDAEGTRTLRKFNTTTPDPFVTISLDGRSAKIIKIQSKLSGTALNLAEVEVFGRTQ